MTTRTTLRIALLGSALGLVFIPTLSAQSQVQQLDRNAAAAAKAETARAARARTTPDAPGPVGTFITFDAPGAGTSPFQGTVPSSISTAGAIAGAYFDASGTAHGFLRATNGTLTTYDVPGAGTTISVFPAGFLFPFIGPFGINPAATITGNYAFLSDPNIVGHGFLRDHNGGFATFDAPGAGTGFFQGTFPIGINPGGVITGTYFDANNVGHGFVRARSSAFITFDAPGAGTTNPVGPGFFIGTQAVNINPEGIVTGIYSIFEGTRAIHHGFLRGKDGNFTTFDPPGFIDTFPYSHLGSTYP